MIRLVSLLALLVVVIACNKKISTVAEHQLAVDTEYMSYLDSARQERVARLTGPQGWLSVIGLHWLEEGVNTIGATADNSIIFPRTQTETIGAYQLQGDDIFFGKVEGVEVNGEHGEYLGGPVVVDYPPTVVNHESLYWYVLQRGERYAIRLKDTLSENRMNFEGISYFPADHNYKVKATVRTTTMSDSVSITNVLGITSTVPIAAQLEFMLQGKHYSLIALDEGTDEFFVIFGDLTNGDSSYGGGRFIYPKKADNGEQTTLDFNLAINPPCAFTDFATCPLPPSKNKMDLRIESGELSPLGH